MFPVLFHSLPDQSTWNGCSATGDNYHNSSIRVNNSYQNRYNTKRSLYKFSRAHWFYLKKAFNDYMETGKKEIENVYINFVFIGRKINSR